MNRQLNAGWQKLRSQAKSNKIAMMKVIGRLRHRHVSMAYMTWRSDYKRILKQKANARKVVGRWKNGASAKAYYRWQAFIDEKEHTRAIIQASLARWRSRGLVMAFNRWIEWLEQVIQTKEMLLKGSKSFLLRAIKMAWTTWHEYYTLIVAQKALASVVIRRWRNKALTACLQHWRLGAALTRKAIHDANKLRHDDSDQEIEIPVMIGANSQVQS